MSSPNPTTVDVMPDMTGETICHGRIRLTEMLGEGGYGVVYRAVHVTSPSVENPREFAVKVLAKASSSSHQGGLQRRELVAHGMVNGHPNILPFHGYTEDDSFLYIVLDYCSGGDLLHAISKGHMFAGNTELVKKVFVQILDGVQSCHEKSIFHRDLKPDNILCKNAEMDVMVADFGLATNATISETFACGSSFYVSPECIGEEFHFKAYSTEKSDIWALGVILVNMVAGRNPWNYATTDDKAFLRYLADPDVFLRDMLPISTPARDILKRIFTLNVDARITIPELRDEILDVDTFFLSESEIAHASKFVKLAAKVYAEGNAAARRTAVDTCDQARRSSTRQGVLIEDHTNHFVLVSKVGTTASEFSSDSDSEGPITPAQYAQEPTITIPDFDENEELGISVLAPVAKIEKRAPSPAVVLQGIDRLIV